MQMHRLALMTSLDTAPNPGAPTVPVTRPASGLVTGATWSRATWALLVVLCGALFLDGLDISMIGVALPSIGTDLHMSAGSLQWIVSAYVLGLRRPVAARRPRRRPDRPPSGVPRRRRRLRCCVAGQWVHEQRLRADRVAARQGRVGRLHRAGRPVDHHHHLRRGPGPQPRAQHLHRLRRQRVLPRPGVRRSPHRTRLAGHPVRPGARGLAARRDRLPAAAARAARADRHRPPRPGRRVHQHRVSARPRLRRGRGAQPRAGAAPPRSACWP